jgi:hypothetical protein
VKLFQGLSPSNVLIIDQKLVRHTPRVMYYHTEESPLFDITEERGALFEFYRKAFKKAWDMETNIERPDLSYPTSEGAPAKPADK